MSEKTKKKNKKLIFFIIYIFSAIIIGALGGVLLVDKISLGNISFIKVIIFLFISVFININIHEFGHFLFGKMFGFRLISYRISFLSWDNENGNMKFSIRRNKGYSGLCAMIPPDTQLENYKSMLFYSGGIILNLLTGIIFISYVYGSLRIFFTITGITAILIGITNLFPFMSTNNPTDGKIIWSLILKKPFSNKLININKLSSQLSAGVRPKNLVVPDNVDLDSPDSLDLIILIYNYFKSLDIEDLDSVFKYAHLIEENLDKFPTPGLPTVYYELCYIGCISNDEDKAKKYYQKAGKILINDKDVNGIRVKAYYEYYVNKNYEAAKNLCENGLSVVDKFPLKGQALMEKVLIVKLINYML